MKKILKNFKKTTLILVLLLSVVFLSEPISLKAKPNPKIQDPGFSAKYVSQDPSDPINIEAGSTKMVEINFKNTGTKTWNPNNYNYVSAYTMDPRYRKSKFSSEQWINSKQTAKINEVVRPGEIGKLKIKLKAPNEPGEYRQKFYLASEDHSWVKNGYFFLDIKVTLPSREPTQKEKNINDPKLKINDPAYQAQYISQSESDPIKITAGDKKRVAVTFKNNGSKTWYPGSANFVSAYTVRPKYNESEFSGREWLKPSQPAKINNIVRPGQRGSLSFNLHAPEKTGTYIEHFHLASENHTWIEDGYFYLKIKSVAPSKQNNKTNQKETKNQDSNLKDDKKVSENKEAEENKQEDNSKQGKYKGEKMFLNKNKIAAPGGERVKIILAAQNSGKNTWSNYKIKLNQNSEVSFADGSWETKTNVLSSDNNIGSDGVFREDFYVRTPPQSGTYTLNLDLLVDDKQVSGVDFNIPVEVTKDADSDYTPAFHEENEEPRWDKEPRIRVGLKKIENNYTLFTPKNDDYKVYKGSDTLMGTLEEGDTATLKKDEDEFTFLSDEVDFDTEKYIRLEPKENPHAKFELGHFNRKIKWKGPKNFDTYRGAFEYRLSDGENSDLFAINDLLMEDYVKGIAETSNNPPMEMLKAQAVAARTYAEHIKETNKHSERNFGVIAHTGDQLYLGVESEKITPRYVQAAEATRGYMITYNDEIVVTPYFGNSNGYTSSWEQVWGDHKPWLVSVRTEYDDGLSILGHEVGMSQRDAAIRARKEDITWRELLHHYYTGVEIEKFYE